MTVIGSPSLDARALAAPDTAPQINWLIDNAEAYSALLGAIRGARRSVWVSQLALDADCVAHANDGSADQLIVGALLAAAARPGMDIRVLLNATLLLDTARPLRRALDAWPHGHRIHVRGVSRFPQLLHAKIVIVDGRDALLLGSPFANGYWDDTTHRPVDARRPARELGGRPVHDVSVRLEGAAVGDLERLFAALWESAGSRREFARGTRSTPRPRAGNTRIVCTAPRALLRDRPHGSTEILDALLDGIARARSLIYIEHQYLSARPVVAALAAALAREPALELVIVLNQNPDVTAYRRWQLARLLEHGLLAHPRAGLFALWSAAPSPGRAGMTLLNQVFVHSKVVIVDDRWAMLGTANLDGVSLHSYGDDFESAPMRRIFRDVRNVDVNVVIDERRPAPTIVELRERLWSEHLGVTRASVAARPRGGWLAMWRRRADRFAAALDGGATGATRDAMRAHVLPFSTESTPRRQLESLGIRVDPRRLDVRFDPGWLEVHCSPGWLRNMFDTGGA